MTSIVLKNWVGGLGNNLEQIANGYWLAQKTNGKFVCEKPHKFLKVPQTIHFGNNLEPMCTHKCTRKCDHEFANVAFINREIDSENERFKSYHKIMQKLAPKLFKDIKPLYFDGLVVHVRSGNIYENPSCGKYMVQAPLSFFAKSMKSLGITSNVLILTESKVKYQNPIITEIKKYCRQNGLKCYLNDSVFEDAVKYLLGAKHAMLTGYSTFSRMLLLAGVNLKSIIIPVMRVNTHQNWQSWPHDEISFKEYGCKVHYFDIKDYIKLWLPSEIHIQHSHPANKVILRGC